jgi:SAM-dependent methyltransferase
MSAAYVHGYHARENERLHDQAKVLVELLHSDTAYPPGSTVLEVGCGVGAQTLTLARRSPGARFTSIDISAHSVAETRRKVEQAGIRNVEVLQADIFDSRFKPESFDHLFVCFVLEHLSEPARALRILSQLLRSGGSITAIEGDHGSAYFYPQSADAQAAIDSLVQIQSAAGGNALIGRQLYPLLIGTGFYEVHVSPRVVYVDSTRPGLAESFIRKTFIAMIEGAREAAVVAGLTTPQKFDAGLKALHRTAAADGVFCYTFFKGIGRRR